MDTMRRITVSVLTAFTMLSGAWAAPADAAPDWSGVTRACRVKDTRILENSGMSRSTYERRVLFTHNDSGDSARFFALGRRCGTRAVFKVPGAPVSDWEDMAAGPHHTLWFGDIGGNNPRSRVDVVRVTEPRRIRSASLAHTAYRLAYPDGAHNAEGLMVRPGSGRVFVVTKASSGAAIYRAPRRLRIDRVNRLTRVASAPAIVTGADFSPTGRLFVLRTYTHAYVYDGLGDADPVDIDLPSAHTFGESVAFARGNAIWFGAEGRRQWVWKAVP